MSRRREKTGWVKLTCMASGHPPHAKRVHIARMSLSKTRLRDAIEKLGWALPTVNNGPYPGIVEVGEPGKPVVEDATVMDAVCPVCRVSKLLDGPKPGFLERAMSGKTKAMGELLQKYIADQPPGTATKLVRDYGATYVQFRHPKDKK